MSTSATTSPPATLRLGTRGSLLARTQSGLVANELEKLHPGLAVELITVKTTGDRITDRPLNEVGGKGLFTKELEQALLAGEVDFAVHSFKDVPVTMPLVDTADLVIAAVPVREDPSDVLVSLRAKSVEELPQGAKVGTSSLRRRCQLLDRRADLSIQPLRGNIDTRLRKLRDGDYDAVILAAAGLRRVGMWDEQIMTRLGAEMMLPAAAQGALALQCRRDDARTRDLLAVMNDSTTASCVAAEREVVNALDGDCHSPIAALAAIERGSSSMHLRVAVGARGGELPVARSAARGPAADASSLVTQAVKLLAAQGVAPGASRQD